jgi:hypothetical protein
MIGRRENRASHFCHPGWLHISARRPDRENVTHRSFFILRRNKIGRRFRRAHPSTSADRRYFANTQQ